METSEQKKVRTRCYSFVMYESPDHFLELFEGYAQYAYIKHDNPDDLENSHCREAHYHLIVYYQNPRYSTSLFKLARELSSKGHQNVFVEPVRNVSDMFLYLTHSDPKSIEENRVQYPSSAIASDDISWWNDISAEGNRTGFSMSTFLTDLFCQSTLYMAITYGRDYIKNASRYIQFRSILIEDFDGDVDKILKEINGKSLSMLSFASDDILIEG